MFHNESKVSIDLNASSERKMSAFQKLPIRVLSHSILAYLDEKELATTTLVDKKLHAAVEGHFELKKNQLLKDENTKINFSLFQNLHSNTSNAYNYFIAKNANEIKLKTAELLSLFEVDESKPNKKSNGFQFDKCNNILSKDNSSDVILKLIIENIIRLGAVNISDGYGYTLLHHLLLNDRVNLIHLIFKNKDFKKINYKGYIVGGNKKASVSPLEIILIAFCDKDSVIDIMHIEELLQYGAQASTIDNEFFLEHIYLPCFTSITDDHTYLPKQKLLSLFTLLSRYGFNINQFVIGMRNFIKEEKNSQNYFEEYKKTPTQQEEAFNCFINALLKNISADSTPQQLMVNMDFERKSDGSETLKLGIDEKTQCCIL